MILRDGSGEASIPDEIVEDCILTGKSRMGDCVHNLRLVLYIGWVCLVGENGNRRRLVKLFIPDARNYVMD